MLTVNHGNHAVLDLLAGGPGRDHLHRHCVVLVRLQLGYDIRGGLPAGASGVDESVGVLVQTFDGIGVVVGLRGHPGAGDGCGALRPTVEALDPLRLCGKKQTKQNRYDRYQSI